MIKTFNKLALKFNSDYFLFITFLLIISVTFFLFFILESTIISSNYNLGLIVFSAALVLWISLLIVGFFLTKIKDILILEEDEKKIRIRRLEEKERKTRIN